MTATNQGGVDAQSSIVIDTLPANLTYTPGSLAITTAPGAGALTDALGDDAGEYDPATRQLRIRLGTGADALAGGSIAAGTSVTFQFDATPTSSATAAQTIENTASASYIDPITESTLRATSQTAVTAVGGELAATGTGVSPLPLLIALLIIVLGAALLVGASQTASPRRR